MDAFRPDDCLWLRAALAAALVAIFPAAGAATAADDRYQEERAACMQRPDTERANCLREAAAARQAARTGELGGNNAYEANRTLRCNALPAADRETCIRRARGEGTVTGSVEGGGILREYREVILPPVPPPAPLPPPTAAPAAPSPSTAPAPVPPQPAPAGVMLQHAQ